MSTPLPYFFFDHYYNRKSLVSRTKHLILNFYRYNGRTARIQQISNQTRVDSIDIINIQCLIRKREEEDGIHEIDSHVIPWLYYVLHYLHSPREVNLQPHSQPHSHLQPHSHPPQDSRILDILLEIKPSYLQIIAHYYWSTRDHPDVDLDFLIKSMSRQELVTLFLQGHPALVAKKADLDLSCYPDFLRLHYYPSLVQLYFQLTTPNWSTQWSDVSPCLIYLMANSKHALFHSIINDQHTDELVSPFDHIAANLPTSLTPTDLEEKKKQYIIRSVFACYPTYQPKYFLRDGGIKVTRPNVKQSLDNIVAHLAPFSDALLQATYPCYFPVNDRREYLFGLAQRLKSKGYFLDKSGQVCYGTAFIHRPVKQQKYRTVSKNIALSNFYLSSYESTFSQQLDLLPVFLVKKITAMLDHFSQANLRATSRRYYHLTPSSHLRNVTYRGDHWLWHYDRLYFIYSKTHSLPVSCNRFLGNTGIIFFVNSDLDDSLNRLNGKGNHRSYAVAINSHGDVYFIISHCTTYDVSIHVYQLCVPSQTYFAAVFPFQNNETICLISHKQAIVLGVSLNPTYDNRSVFQKLLLPSNYYRTITHNLNQEQLISFNTTFFRFDSKEGILLPLFRNPDELVATMEAMETRFCQVGRPVPVDLRHNQIDMPDRLHRALCYYLLRFSQPFIFTQYLPLILSEAVNETTGKAVNEAVEKETVSSSIYQPFISMSIIPCKKILSSQGYTKIVLFLFEFSIALFFESNRAEHSQVKIIPLERKVKRGSIGFIRATRVYLGANIKLTIRNPRLSRRKVTSIQINLNSNFIDQPFIEERKPSNGRKKPIDTFARLDNQGNILPIRDRKCILDDGCHRYFVIH